MPKYISIYVNENNADTVKEIDKQLKRLKLNRNKFFNALLLPMKLRLEAMQDGRDLFNGNFGPIKMQ